MTLRRRSGRIPGRWGKCDGPILVCRGRSVSIINLLNQIKDEEIVLPAIQRNFVWTRDRIYNLLDSILRGYPVGIVLLWETYEDIRYRRFTKEYQAEVPLTFHDNDQRLKLKVVLDG